jgi:predicted PolB exonuclease-like 3'-5' exonuclease
MPANHKIYFDIETGPMPLSELVIPPFVASDVKLGNIKNPDLIAEKIQRAEETHVSDYIRGAALDALSGQILCIGYRIEHETPSVLCCDADGEAEMLRQWWQLISSMERQPSLIGFNVKPFDLPFLIKRSWKHRITPPYWIRQGRYWSELVVDLREVWQLGDSRAHGSLGAISRHLGLGDKAGNGAMFSELFKTDREAAINYCLRDVELTQKVADVLMPAY